MIEQFTLPNGLRVLCEQLPHLRSVSMGVWVKAGSILEREHENGLSHLIEHMAFKGTGRRSARQIAQEMDAVGGYLNAATSKLCTCYYAKVIDENLPLAADILSDIVRFPAIDPKELDKERNVVLEEISMTDDSPEDVAYDLIASAMFGKQPLGQTILGPRELIAGYTREDVLAFRARHYSPMNTVNQRPQTLTADKDTEQAHICLGYRGKPLGDADAYPMAVFNSILGGGMSSRLFQRIREESAMAYSVYSAPSAYPHCGDFTIYAAVSPRNVKTVLAQIDEETSLLVREGATQDHHRRNHPPH